MIYETSKKDGVGEFVLTKPPVNACGPQEFEGIAEGIRTLGADEDVRVIVLRGEGKGFCAGLDIRRIESDPACMPAANRGAFNAFEAIHKCDVPVIAAVHGFALGAGLAMVGASDIVIAAKGARFGLPEINVGLLGGASHALRILPLPKVRWMYYTGEPIDADEMYRLGAAECVVAPDNLVETAHALASKIAEKSSRGLRFAKESMNGIEPVNLEKNYRFEQGFTFEITHLNAQG